MRSSPYVEWYQNSIAIEGSPAACTTPRSTATGPTTTSWPSSSPVTAAGSPTPWADLFEQAGARYVVLVTKHHDGFLPVAERDAQPAQAGVGERARPRRRLADGRRGAGPALRHLLLRRARLDLRRPARSRTSRRCSAAIPQTPEYLAYADAHWHELIERYQPDVLWNDIGYPRRPDLDGAVRRLLRAVPDGVVNNRFDWIGPTASGPCHRDFMTPEYSTRATPRPRSGRATAASATRSATTGQRTRRLPPDRRARCGSSSTSSARRQSAPQRRPTADGRSRGAGARLRALGAWLRTTARRSTGPALGPAPTARRPPAKPIRFTTKDDAGPGRDRRGRPVHRPGDAGRHAAAGCRGHAPRPRHARPPGPVPSSPCRPVPPTPPPSPSRSPPPPDEFPPDFDTPGGVEIGPEIVGSGLGLD